ncbi:hypothetical protein JOB18_027219 [Solea senegalensis]|uniref:Uncharacterized protein n=1 Tax=Solea senegalensis TaxID=28829 RepID=A0AAV6R5S0_SOLSE|nr:hypothetical protein JOB18_027219 [Solea senegalensis]
MASRAPQRPCGDQIIVTKSAAAGLKHSPNSHHKAPTALAASPTHPNNLHYASVCCLKVVRSVRKKRKCLLGHGVENAAPVALPTGVDVWVCGGVDHIELCPREREKERMGKSREVEILTH